MKPVKQTYLLMTLVGLVLLSGCATVGNDSLRNENNYSISQKLVSAKTTMAEVRTTFGNPMNTSFTDGGLEVWTYENVRVHEDPASYIPIVNLFAASASGTKKELVILFDENNVVKKYKMVETAVKQRTGLFNQ